MSEGSVKMDVFDPVLGSGCVTPTSQNIAWHAVRPATNDALFSAFARWIVENERYDAAFLSYPNLKSAEGNGYGSFTNAAHLVIVDEAHPNYRKMLTPSDAGLESSENPDFVVVDKASATPVVASACEAADINFVGTVNGIKVSAAFVLFKEALLEKSMEEYSQATQVPVGVLEATAKEFTSHGTKACAVGMGGHVALNGAYATMGYMCLNALIGSNNMQGGLMPHRNPGVCMADGKRYLLQTVEGAPNVSAKNATHISRTGKVWEKTDEYKNRVAAGEKNPTPKLPWYLGSFPSDTQALSGAINGYPYQAKILLTWMTGVLQGSPGYLNDEVRAKLCDPEIIPLHIACDAFMGELADMADYIVPDTTPFESFGLITVEGYWAGKGNSVRWPVREPETIALEDGRHASFEAFACDVASSIGMPGFGENAFADTEGNKHPWFDAADYFLKAVANLAYDGDPVADASESDIKVQGLDDLPEAWRSTVTEEEWPKVLNVLSRGGRYWPIEDVYDGNGRGVLRKSFMSLLYSEHVGAQRNDYSGEFFPGTLHMRGERLSDGTLISERFDPEQFPFAFAQYKPKFRSATNQANSPIMRDMCPSNYIEMNMDDAADLGIADGDVINVINPDGATMTGPVMLRGGIAKGTIAFPFGYGHVSYGAKSYEVDGEEVAGVPEIAAGTRLQTVKDPVITDALYYAADKITAAPGRNGGMYRVEKA